MTTLQEKIAALREGDEVEVEWNRDGHTSTERGVLYEDGGGLWIGIAMIREKSSLPRVFDITDVRVITPADPGCPFPMGATVRYVGASTRHVVTEWAYYGSWGRWMVKVSPILTDGRPNLTVYALCDPDELELVPENPEPPSGTPVWFAREWWAATAACPSVMCCLTAERDTMLWADMPGAIPAATPEATS